MIIFAKQLIGLRVETKSGQMLGRIRDFEIDADTLEIKKFYVRPAGIVRGLTDGDLIIAKSMIVAIDEKKMTVDDLVTRELARERAGQQVTIKSSPVVASSREDC